ARYALSLPDALPICGGGAGPRPCARRGAQAVSKVVRKRASAAKAAAKPRIRARSGRLSKQEVHELFSRLRELNPHPTTELEYSTDRKSTRLNSSHVK